MRLAACLIACGLLAGCASQIVIVPDSPDGTPTTVDVEAEQGRVALGRPGYALYTDPHVDVIYRVGETDIGRDFGPSLEAMRDTLAAGLPELPHSYMVLLAHPRGPLGSLAFETADGRPGQPLQAPREAAFIDGYPGRPAPPDERSLQRDFGAALAALRETLKVQRSYLLLLESPDGEGSRVVFRTRQRETLLGSPGECLTLDGLAYDPDEAVVGRDFADSRAATRQILEAGLPRLPHSYAALLESAQGPVGEVEVLDGEARGVILDQAGQAVIIDGYSEQVFRLDEAQARQDFGESLAAMPLPPVTLPLYFEPGSARLDRDALAVLPAILEEIRKRPAADVTIAGFADTVNESQVNERLSRRRAEAVAAYLRGKGAPALDIHLAAFGETLLAVTTPDNKPEALNRRVEVSIR